eukprot:TRINITY_DN3412_c0_g2_i10.p1 TRINITY_DN3412_c0_g2~~TRINITY_DN3412_c0_g2_i10.p1  ORF type:complete len:665 (-),score=140.25 TRINITY_DN3412_c0_g2_i10:751-2673(-)
MDEPLTGLIEIALVEHKWEEVEKTRVTGGLEQACVRMCISVVKGKYEETLKESLVRQLLDSVDQENRTDPFECLRSILDDFLLDHEGDERLKQLFLLLCGVSFLSIFIQNNWTGPSSKPPSLFPNYNDSIMDLEVDGEVFYKHVRAPQYLQAANLLLVSMSQDLSLLKTTVIWTARCSFVHQQCLLGPSDKLYRTILGSFEKATFLFPPPQTDKAEPDVEENLETRRKKLLAAQVELEFGLVLSFYKNSSGALEHFKQAMRYTGLLVQLCGALGRRTKYQSFDTSQLVLLARSKLGTDSEVTSVPVTVENMDPCAVALENIKYVDSIPDANNNIHPLDQAIMLSLCLFLKNNNPRNGLTSEEMWAYIERVLKNPNNWLIHSMGLLLKSRLEVIKSKTVDRACLQLEVLTNQFDSELEKKEYSVDIRMRYFYGLAFPTHFRLQREMGRRWLSIGSIDSALLIFRSLEMWEDVIKCHVIKQDTEKARELLDVELAKKETPELLCILGDLTKDPTHYEKAWNLSRGRCSRAKRSLGIIAMEKLELEAAAQHFLEAVKINPQYASIWFRLGCCALGMNDLELGKRAFSRVVQLYPDDSEAWNNLAAVYVKQKKKFSNFCSSSPSLPPCTGCVPQFFLFPPLSQY